MNEKNTLGDVILIFLFFIMFSFLKKEQNQLTSASTNSGSNFNPETIKEVPAIKTGTNHPNIGDNLTSRSRKFFWKTKSTL